MTPDREYCLPTVVVDPKTGNISLVATSLGMSRKADDSAPEEQNPGLCSLSLPPLFGIESEIRGAESELTAKAIGEMPAKKVKQLVLSLLASGRVVGLSEALGVEERIASALRASLAALLKQK